MAQHPRNRKTHGMTLIGNAGKRFFAHGHDRYDSSMGGLPPDLDAFLDEDINCMVLHPVEWPNQGPAVELYLAEEAIGLAKSLGWDVVTGPLWYQLMEEDENYISEMTTDMGSSEEDEQIELKREAREHEEGGSQEEFSGMDITLPDMRNDQEQ